MKRNIIKIYIDDLRPTPEGYLRCYRVDEAIGLIEFFIKNRHPIELSLDHDAGDCGPPDYIAILDWLEEEEEAGRLDCSQIFFYLHTGNPVGRDNMWRIIKKRGWKLIEHAEDF